MSQPYQFNFPDMARFFDDLKHVLQTGGAHRLLQYGGEGTSLMEKVKNVFVLIFIILLIYMLYIILFGGYPRPIVNLLTLSFYHKESMDYFLRENNVLHSAFQTIQFNTNGCDDPIKNFDFVFKTNLATQLLQQTHQLDELIKTSYSELKYEEQFYQAMTDYYLYYNKVDVAETIDVITVRKSVVENIIKALKAEKGEISTIVPSEVKNPKDDVTDMTIKNRKFYEQMLGYFINKGIIRFKGKSDDEQLMEAYLRDQEVNFKFYNRFIGIKGVIDGIGATTQQMTALIRQSPYLAFLILPENSQDIQAFAQDYQKNTQAIDNGTIYQNVVADDLNDFSWYTIEYLQYKRDPIIFNKFEADLSQIRYNQREVNTIKKYLNVPIELKQKAELKIFNRVLEKKIPKLIDPSRNNSEDMYSVEERCSPDFFDFIKKHPIFIHVWFADDIADKSSFYRSVMDMYNRLCTSCGSSNDYLTNLKVNSIGFKKYVNAINSFDLFLNMYKPKIVQTYQDQNYANKFFFTRLMKPYYEDFVLNRMQTHYKRTFNKKKWNKSYNKFRIYWAKLGQLLKNGIQSIFRSFKTSTNVSEPEAPSE